MIESKRICSLLLLVAVACVSSTLAQDPNFCKPVPDPNNKPKPTIDLYSQFQATIEVNKMGVTEMWKEYYDGLLNIGIAIQTALGITNKVYCYYSLNEGLSISGDKCRVFKLNESDPVISGIFEFQNVDGIMHIKTPLSSLLQNSAFVYVYTGVGEARGIAVDQWQACYYASQTRTNYKITVSFSSGSRWPSMKESPVQVTIETKVDGANDVNIESYSVIEYRPFLSIQEEEYFTPTGVYCPGRYNQRQVPKMPEHFRFILQAATQLGTPDNGLIETFAEEYNYKNKLFMFVHDDRNFFVTDIHDYNTGWGYSIDRFSGNCTRSPLTLNVSIDSAIENGIVGLRDPKKFFDFDNLNPQYIGLKRRDGVNNDVYVGKGQLFGVNVVVEWYFLSGTWQASQIWPGLLKDGFQLPVEIKFFLELPIGQQVKYNHIFAFEPKWMDLKDFDISECTHQVEKRHYMFSMKNDMAQLIKSNQNSFVHSLTQVLHQNARITILRLSRIEMAFDVDQIHVFFTMSEKVEKYGPVEIPKDDVPLEEAETTLRQAFTSDKIQIEFYDWTKDTSYTVPVIKDSLKQVFFNDSVTIVIDRDMTIKGYSDGTTAIVTIVGAIVGLVVGVLATMFIKYKNIKLPLINK